MEMCFSLEAQLTGRASLGCRKKKRGERRRLAEDWRRGGDLEMETRGQGVGPKMEAGERGGRREGGRGQGGWEPGASVRKGVGKACVSLSGATGKL